MNPQNARGSRTGSWHGHLARASHGRLGRAARGVCLPRAGRPWDAWARRPCHGPQEPHRSFIHAAAVLLAAAIAASPAPAAGAARLISNGDFEAAAANDANLPAAWTPHSQGKVAVAWPAGVARCWLAIAGLLDEPLPVRFEAAGEGDARRWPVRLLTTPASTARPWGELNSLGTLLIPAGRPRLVRVEITPTKAKPGTHVMRLSIQVLDRTAEAGQVTVRVTVPRP